jgi:tetratricopeptide (TPR) repeat protein
MTDAEIAEHLALIARQLLLHGNAEDALALLDSAVALSPEDTATIALQCEAAHRAGRHDEAHERLTALLTIAPQGSRTALSKLDARVLLALGRRIEAEDLYRRAVDTSIIDIEE